MNIIFEVNADFIRLLQMPNLMYLGKEDQNGKFSSFLSLAPYSYLPRGNQTVPAWTFSNTIATWQHLQQVRIPVSLALSKFYRYFRES